MNTLDFYCKLYSKLRNYGMPLWVMTPARRIVRKMVNTNLPNYLSKPIKNKSELSDVIVSFTSFPARIDNVWQVVECMFRQTLTPSKILLWLSKEQFPSANDIPDSLKRRQNDIFEIKLVEGDYRSHKKYLYACQENPNSVILLIDDDIYYPTNFIEKMYYVFKKQECVICNYGFLINHNDDGSVSPYKTWREIYSYSEDKDFFFGSGGGVMFNPTWLYKDLTNIELALTLTPLADDIWLNAMVRLAGIKIIKIKSGLVLPVCNGINNVTLASQNVSEGKNDTQLQALEQHYVSSLKRKIFSVNIVS